MENEKQGYLSIDYCDECGKLHVHGTAENYEHLFQILFLVLKDLDEQVTDEVDGQNAIQ